MNSLNGVIVCQEVRISVKCNIAYCIYSDKKPPRGKRTHLGKETGQPTSKRRRDESCGGNKGRDETGKGCDETGKGRDETGKGCDETGKGRDETCKGHDKLIVGCRTFSIAVNSNVGDIITSEPIG